MHHYLCCLEFSLKFRLLVFVISSVSLRHFKISPVSLTPLLSLLSRTLSFIIYDVSNRVIIISDVSRGQFVISTVSFALICNLYCLPVPFCNLSCLTVRFCNLCCLVALYIPISCVPLTLHGTACFVALYILISCVPHHPPWERIPGVRCSRTAARGHV